MEIKLINIRLISMKMEIYKRLLLTIMKTFIFLLCTTVFSFNSDNMLSQEKVRINQDKLATVDEVFKIIKKQTDLKFIYPKSMFKDAPKVQLRKGEILVSTLLENTLTGNNASFELSDNNLIIIKYKANPSSVKFTNARQSQEIQISGTTADANGPLPGVSVQIKKANKGTSSNEMGLYTITARATDTLIFSYLGYLSQEIPVRGRNQINVLLTPEAQSLNEVVINAGYYNTTNRTKTGSIARITAKEIENQPVINPLEAMQGRMSGVDIVQSSGITGGGFEVKIRGQNSILAGNSPLYIIDGVPFDSGSLGSRNTSLTIIPNANISPLNAINPATIESIEVLKDADATAIYGSRGANGVILITTKKGTTGKARVNFSASSGIAQITTKLNLLNTEQYLNMRREAFANDGITDYPANAYDVNGTWDQNRHTDWQKVLIGNEAIISNLQASISGGSQTTQFLISGMTQNETTVFPKEFKYQRLNITANLNHQSLDKRFEINFNTSYSIENNTLPGTDLTYNATRLAPNAPELYDENGNLNWENSTWTNPLAELEGDYNNNIKTLLANAGIQYKMSNNLMAKINLGYTTSHLDAFRTYRHTMFDPAFGLTSNLVSRTSSNQANRISWIVEPQLMWSKKINNSRINVIVGSTFQTQDREQLEITAVGFVDNSFIYNLSAANTIRITGENKLQYKYQSIFGRINYSLKDKIFVNLTARRDGSSRFGSDNKFGNFGAVGAAWLFNDVLKQPWLSLGKLRASYGITGNDQINDYQYLQTYLINNNNNYDGNIGIDPTRLFNPNFKWENNKKLEIGIELGLFNNKINLSSAYYNNRSSNQLINYTLPGTTGFSGIQANLNALVANSGWEFDVNMLNINTENFQWQTNLNLSIPKNKLIDFPNLENTTYANQYVIGEPLTVLKLYKFNGVNQDTGLFEFEDYNNDGVISSLEDRQYLVDLSPQLFGGIANTLSYNNWGLDIFFQWVKKDGFNRFYNSDTAGSFANQPIEILDRWQQQGDNTTIQQFTSGANPLATLAYNQFRASSAGVSDASFVRLKSIALTYQLTVNRDKNQSCRIALQGQNLFTITSFKNGDPEQPSRFFLPPLRRMMLSAQFQF